MENNILDFTDYAKPFDFKYNGNIYRIPAFSKSQIEKLMQINKRFMDLEKQKKDLNDPDKLEDTGSYFVMQDEFLSSALFKKNESGGFNSIDPDELDEWPVKVKNKITNEIGKQMSTNITDEEEDNTSKKS
jgi:hypothetical protein